MAFIFQKNKQGKNIEIFLKTEWNLMAFNSKVKTKHTIISNNVNSDVDRATERAHKHKTLVIMSMGSK